MAVALWAVAVAFIVSGIITYRGAWLCHAHPERAGFWMDRRTGLAAFVYILTVSGPLFYWLAQGGLEELALRGAIYVLGLLLHQPLVVWHSSSLIADMLNPAGTAPDEPEDPLERAKAAEEQGDVPAAIERYRVILKKEPFRLEARLALAELFARTMRRAQAEEVLLDGLRLLGDEDASREKLEEALRKVVQS